jgi:hypothetical protein
VTLYYGQNPGRAKLSGPERALDGFIGLIVLVVEVLVGILVLLALAEFGMTAELTGAADADALTFGIAIAVFGSGIVFVITTIVYLVRLATARRSWPAPLWGLILVSVACIAGYFIMTTGS